MGSESRPMNFAVVSASLDPDATRHLWGSWRQRATLEWPLIMVHNAPGATRHLRLLTSTDAGPVAERAPQGTVEVAEVPIPGSGEFIWVKHEGVLGPIPAFDLGIKEAIRRGADVIAALHDDLRVDQDGWDQLVVQFFQDHPHVRLVGFCGANGLGEAGI